jgi:hypothetical protein
MLTVEELDTTGLDPRYHKAFKQSARDDHAREHFLPMCGEILRKAEEIGDEKLQSYCKLRVKIAAIGDWCAPIPISLDHELPSFPTECLPAWMRDWAIHAAKSYQVDQDLPSIVAMGLYSGALGRRVQIQVRPGWTEQLSLYQMIILPPGEGKSPIFSAAKKPLADTEKQLIQFYQPELARAYAEKKAFEGQLTQAEKTLARETDSNKRAILLMDCVKLRMSINEIGNPSEPRLYCDDTTPERLASLMAENNSRVIMPSAESDGLFTAIGRYNESPNLGIILKAWSGEDTRVDRVSKEATILERPVLNITIATQPAALKQLLNVPGFRGRGLADRFLYSMPQTMSGKRVGETSPIPEKLTSDYHAYMAAAWGILDSEKPSSMFLTPGAKKRHQDYIDQIESKLAPDGEYAPISGHCNKMKSYVLRFAGVINAADTLGDSGPIREEDVEGGAQIANYYIQHAYHVLSHSKTDQTPIQARAISSWIKRGKYTSFHEAEAAEAIGTHLEDPDVDDTLRHLANHHQIQRTKGQVYRWEVNPLLDPISRLGIT